MSLALDTYVQMRIPDGRLRVSGSSHTPCASRRRWASLNRMPDRATLNAVVCALMGAAVCGAFSPGTQAQAAGDAAELARGEHIARLVCATCHVVARDQEYPPLLSKPAPSFFELANRPGVNAESLERFVTTTHWDNPDKLAMTMPDLRATPEQSRAVARYILSLRKH